MNQHEAKNSNGKVWLSLVDYAAKNRISLSTLRRYIKANKVEFEIRNGRYYLLDNEGAAISYSAPQRSTEDELRRATEEISELRMLVSLYEEKLGSRLGAN